MKLTVLDAGVLIIGLALLAKAAPFVAGALAYQHVSPMEKRWCGQMIRSVSERMDRMDAEREEVRGEVGRLREERSLARWLQEAKIIPERSKWDVPRWGHRDMRK